MESLIEEQNKLLEALTPSSYTKAFHIGEYSFSVERREWDEDGKLVEYTEEINIPWTSIKDIMKGVLDYAKRLE